MKAIDDKQETVTFRAMSTDEAGMKRVEKVEVSTHNMDTLKHMEKKLIDKGVQRKDRHPIDGQALTGRLAKSGHGGKYTWEGPEDDVANELEAGAPAAIDEGDPNYVDEEAEGKILRGEVSGVEGYVVGEVEVAKLAEGGISGIVVEPELQRNV